MKSTPNERRSLAARLLDPRLGLALASAAFVTWYALREAREELGAGPLSRVHAALPELALASGCAACHGEGASAEATPHAAMATACTTCHVEVGAQLASETGFHGLLVDGSDCARCHTEHLGPDLEPYSPEAFVLAGFASRDAYAHEGLGFELTGVHTSLGCVTCHPLADASSDELAAARAVDSTVGRFLGRSPACTSCHEDVHDGAFGPSCADCHGQERPFDEAARFVHTAEFALAGAHAGHACTTCHAEGSTYTIGAYADAATRPAARGCVDCHASPHGVAFVAAAGSSCAACHAPHVMGFARADEALTRSAHAVTGFVLAAPGATASDAHGALACEACHDPSLAFGPRHPGRDSGACALCHADPHGGQYGDAAASPALCSGCHGTVSFADHTFDAAAHAAAGFPLDGAHASTACNACHRPAAPGEPARYRGTPRACAACHEDVHGGLFDRTPSEVSVVAATRDAGDVRAPQTEGCARCHDTRSFRGAADGFEHGAWTGYSLEGAHAAVACQECHLQEPGGGRRLGPVAQAFAPAFRDGATRTDLASCTPCHGDPHAGRFDVVALPAVVDGRAGCARCHESSSFAEVPASRFDHGRWTGFELRGAHEHTRCSACHGEGSSPAEPSIRTAVVARRLGVVADRFPGPIDQCATCHTNPHGARYDVHAPELVEGRVGCARCHGEATFRQPVAFDHGWTGFGLDGAHADVACVGCHPTVPPDAQGRTRGAPAGSTCAACHADPHGGQFQVGAVNDCARCHAVGAPFDAPTFDHAASRFPLDDVHARLACADCHRPARTKDGRELVRYRPLGTACADCHGATGKRKD